MNHIVAKGIYFGYIIGRLDARRLSVVVMRADVLKGGDPCLIDRVISAGRDEVRPATEEDYKRFKIAL